MQGAFYGSEIVDGLAFGILLGKEVGLVLGHGASDDTIFDNSREVRTAHDGGQVMPMPCVSFAANPSLGAIDVRRGGFLPEGPRDAHHEGRCDGKRHAIDLTIHVAHHRHHLVWLTGCPATEFQRDDRRDVACALLDRGVVQQQFVAPFAGDFKLYAQLFAVQRSLDKRLDGAGDPFRKTVAHGLCPFGRLAAIRRQELIATGEVGNQFADVVGEINVFGEPVDELVCFRERRAALEGQVGTDWRIEQRSKGPDHPHILFEQMCGAAGPLARQFENFALVVLAEIEITLSHEQLPRRWPSPSTRAKRRGPTSTSSTRRAVA